MYVEIQFVKIEIRYCCNVKMHVIKERVCVCEGERKMDLQVLQVKPSELQQ